MKKIALVFIVLFGLHACQRSRDAIGPASCPSADFNVTRPFTFKDSVTTNANILDLSNSYAIVDAAFNESISYALTINGEASGAQYVYNGISSTIHRHWYGNSTNGKNFVKGETLSYTLKNLCQTEPLGAGTIVLSTIIGFSKVDKTFGLFVSNGENEPYKIPFGSMVSPPCGIQNNPGATLFTPNSVGYSPSPQGGNYYHYKATCNGSTTTPTGYYFGGVDYATSPAMFATLPTDPNRVYLNFYAKGQHNSLAAMIFFESVYGEQVKRIYNKAVVSQEWTLFSVRLSDLGIIDPSQISELSFNLNTYFADSSAEVDMDMVIFTIDKPL